MCHAEYDSELMTTTDFFQCFVVNVEIFIVSLIYKQAKAKASFTRTSEIILTQ